MVKISILVRSIAMVEYILQSKMFLLSNTYNIPRQYLRNMQHRTQFLLIGTYSIDLFIHFHGIRCREVAYINGHKSDIGNQFFRRLPTLCILCRKRYRHRVLDIECALL